MAYDYAERLCNYPATFTTFARTTLRLCDFPAKVCDFDRAADLFTGSAAFPFPGLIGAAGSTAAAWALPGFRPDRGGVFALYNV
jgi:hypothetical protein|nr:MAG TPA: hypothetical protein [Caudoviricetes sp.]